MSSSFQKLAAMLPLNMTQSFLFPQYHHVCQDRPTIIESFPSVSSKYIYFVKALRKILRIHEMSHKYNFFNNLFSLPSSHLIFLFSEGIQKRLDYYYIK